MPVELGLVNGEVWAAEHVDTLEAAINDKLEAGALDAVEDAVDVLEVITARLGAGVTRAAAQSIPDSTATLVAWTAELFDVGGFITVTDDELTVPAGGGGLYVCVADLTGPAGWHASNAYQALLGVNWNPGGGVFDDGTVSFPAGRAAQALGPACSALFDLVVGDRVGVLVSQTSGSPQDFTGGLRIGRISL